MKRTIPHIRSIAACSATALAIVLMLLLPPAAKGAGRAEARDHVQ